MKFIIGLAIATAIFGQSLRVEIVNRATKAPIAGALVTCVGENETISGRTDAAGSFSAKVAVGSKLIAVSMPNFAMPVGGVMGRKVEVKESETNVRIEMSPLAVIAGRVVDQYGDPVNHAIVSTQVRNSSSTFPQDFESAYAEFTDDRGEFRLAGVAPGRYYLAIEYDSHNDRLNRASRYQWPRFGGWTLYPNAPDVESGQLIEVHSGESIRLGDAHLNLERAIVITGHVRGTLAPRTSVDAEPKGDRPSRRQSGGLAMEVSEGGFRLEVLPGTYTLTARDGSGKRSKPITIEARDKNISGLEFTLGPGGRISGRILIDGSETLDFTKLQLNFLGEPLKIDSSGSFHGPVEPGVHRFVLQGLPDGWYVKNVRVAGQSIAGRTFTADSEKTDIQFTLSARGARVEFVPERADDVFNKAAVFVLIPEHREAVTLEECFIAQGDASGRLIARGVPPGEYRAFALDVANYPLVFNPALLLKNYRNLAPLITVGEGEEKKLTLAPITIPEQ